MQKRLLGVLATPFLVLGLVSCGSHDNTTAATPATPATTSVSDSSTPSTSTSPSTPVGGSSSAGSGAAGGTCVYNKVGTAAKPVNLPPSTPAYTAKTPAVISTTAGDIHVVLNGDTTPCTVNSFASLATQGFYDNTPCPRITTDVGFQLLQCGDPTGTGAGGPGYQFADELSGTESYPAGTLAMANSGPGTGTNGSQFFIVYGDTQLGPDYTVFGTVTIADLAGIKAIGAKGSDNSNPAGGGKPATAISITKVTIGG